MSRLREEGASGGFGEVAEAGRVSARLGQRGAGSPDRWLHHSGRRRAPGWGKLSTPLPLRLGPAGSDRQAPRSYLPPVNKMSAAEPEPTPRGLKEPRLLLQADPEELPHPRRQVEGSNVARNSQPPAGPGGNSVPLAKRPSE